MDIFVDADAFRIAGLPLHPLLVHAVVVLAPLTALVVALAAVWPAARRRLGFAPAVAALAVAGLVPLTALAGQDLADRVGRTPAIERHEALGEMLIPWTLALLVAAVAVALADRMPARRRTDAVARATAAILPVVAVVAAAGTIVVTVLAGDAGARAVWEGI